MLRFKPNCPILAKRSQLAACLWIMDHVVVFRTQVFIKHITIKLMMIFNQTLKKVVSSFVIPCEKIKSIHSSKRIYTSQNGLSSSTRSPKIKQKCLARHHICDAFCPDAPKGFLKSFSVMHDGLLGASTKP